MSAQAVRYLKAVDLVDAAKASETGFAVRYSARCLEVHGECRTQESLQELISVLNMLRPLLPTTHDDFPDGLWNVGAWTKWP